MAWLDIDDGPGDSQSHFDLWARTAGGDYPLVSEVSLPVDVNLGDNMIWGMVKSGPSIQVIIDGFTVADVTAPAYAQRPI